MAKKVLKNDGNIIQAKCLHFDQILLIFKKDYSMKYILWPLNFKAVFFTISRLKYWKNSLKDQLLHFQRHRHVNLFYSYAHFTVLYFYSTLLTNVLRNVIHCVVQKYKLKVQITFAYYLDIFFKAYFCFNLNSDSKCVHCIMVVSKSHSHSPPCYKQNVSSKSCLISKY